jgi:hypothetical protein
MASQEMKLGSPKLADVDASTASPQIKRILEKKKAQGAKKVQAWKQTYHTAQEEIPAGKDLMEKPWFDFYDEEMGDSSGGA